MGTTGLGPPEHQSDHHDHHEDGDHNHDHHDDVSKYDGGDNLGFGRLTTNHHEDDGLDHDDNGDVDN